MTGDHAARAQRARMALAHYRTGARCRKLSDRNLDEATIDLLADLRHLHGDAFELLETVAYGHYLDETDDGRVA